MLLLQKDVGVKLDQMFHKFEYIKNNGLISYVIFFLTKFVLLPSSANLYIYTVLMSEIHALS